MNRKKLKATTIRVLLLCLAGGAFWAFDRLVTKFLRDSALGFFLMLFSAAFAGIVFNAVWDNTEED